MDDWSESFRERCRRKGVILGVTRIGVHAGPAIIGKFVGGRPSNTLERRTMKAPKPKQWAEREVQQLFKLARAGAGVSKIAAELGRHAGSVRRMARAMGILLKK
ncbi:hypothetical protein [Bradyrhizobium sp. 142]|nr:hypothetical protein [Bradyrhizobium sp. 142]